ncbi:MAG: hypothetical protein K2N22_06535, partial [Clostridia bacterium]|nr:hypothetical protein [Clostridia bacterium]
LKSATTFRELSRASKRPPYSLPTIFPEAIALSDKVVVLSARPAKVVAEHLIEFGEGSPKKRRECSEFSATFEVLRKELGI